MYLILLRHGDKLNGSNPPLSDRGLHQAQNLLESLNKLNSPMPTSLFSSPKRRTQETLQPLAQALGLAVHQEERLHQRHFNESTELFRDRLRAWLMDVVRDQPSETCIVACSHIDVMDEFRSLLPGAPLNAHDFDHWSTAQFAVLKGPEHWTLVSQGRAQ